jgi:putative PIN family toxin of toxin-antitoxin system
MNRIVLDTNVLVSGMINAHGAPGRIVDLVREEQVELVVDDRVLAEYRDVLHRPKFRRYFDHKAVRDIMNFLEQNTSYAVPVRSLAGLPDPDDAPFAELALSAGVPLVTGNAGDYPASLRRAVRVLAPAEYLAQREVT